MKRWLVFLYGVTSYLMFFGVFLYFVLFIGNYWIVRSLDAAPTTSFVTALAVNMGLLVLFSVQHSGMARPAFKKWLTQFIPEPAERSTYVLMSNLAMIAIFAFWQPMGIVIWEVENLVAKSAIEVIFFSGWGLLFLTTWGICHFDLFGLRQIWKYFRREKYEHYEFQVNNIYKNVRHPIYFAWLIVIWAAPVMTISHLLFSVGTTIYILIGIKLEERDLIAFFGDEYVKYRQQVPMLIPRISTAKLQSDANTKSKLVAKSN